MSILALISNKKIAFYDLHHIKTILKLIEGHDNVDFIAFICDKLINYDISKAPAFFKDKRNLEYLQSMQANTNYVFQRRVQVTPTLYIFKQGGFQESNKVVRENGGIIRINFVNEFLRRGLYNGEENKLMTEHISELLKDGLRIFDKSYQFLSYSNS
jgi:hypothetical protein